ncbi:unnamed protein product [Tuber aestivum]|uniref:Uncharacterized protein n=1 Tax=Tuber aestivum TaxID=59557 RepID=A0A292PLJ7_9PEZI|nr:unnamed protein product [Tuber aestivum]
MSSQDSFLKVLGRVESIELEPEELSNTSVLPPVSQDPSVLILQVPRAGFQKMIAAREETEQQQNRIEIRKEIKENELSVISTGSVAREKKYLEQSRLEYQNAALKLQLSGRNQYIEKITALWAVLSASYLEVS